MSYQIQKDPLPRTTTRKIKRLELKRMIESGQLRETEAAAAEKARPEDQALMESPVGQEVLRCLRETHHREGSISPGMNLELDLGFDSMERVELMANLEQALNLQLPEYFGAEIFTVRDLIVGLEQEAISGAGGGAVARQSWSTLLAEESPEKEREYQVRFSRTPLTLLKYLGLRLVYIICRIFLRLETRGPENLPKAGPYLICPNHLSYLDPFIVMCLLPYRAFKRTFFVGASEYYVYWYMKILARLANIVPVDPDSHLLRAMKVGAHGLRRGRILCIFPEGARSYEGDLKEFKKGAAILAREIGVPIVPVGINGTYEVWPRDSMRIRPHKVRLAFGPPLLFPRSSDDPTYEADTAKLRHTVERLIRGVSTQE